MNYAIATPEGMNDRLFAECAAYRAVQNTVTGLFSHRGYSEVTTPELEYYDVLLQSGSPLPQEEMVKVIDRASRILVLRPDNTAPIARLAATKLRALPLPQRLFYCQHVYRSDDAHKGVRTDTSQCGVELIGASGIRADLEVLTTAVQALQALGIEDFQIELGHAGFFPALAAELHADAALAQQLRACVEQKNFAAYNDLLAPYRDTTVGRSMAQLGRLFGGVEVLQEARALCSGAPCVQALDYLEELYQELDAAGIGDKIVFDLALVQRIDYYTGVIFRGYVRGSGQTVLSGGRYDTLAGKFGMDVPATGLALDIEQLTHCLPVQETARPDTIVYYARGCLGGAMRRVTQSRQGSCVLSAAVTESGAAEEGRRLGAKTLVVITADGERSVAL